MDNKRRYDCVIVSGSNEHIEHSGEFLILHKCSILLVPNILWIIL